MAFVLELNESSISELKSEIRSMFEEIDECAFKKIINSFNLNHQYGKYDAVCSEMKAHPLALHWAKLEYEANISIENSRISLSLESFIFADRIIALKNSAVLNKDKIIVGIMNSGTFYSSMFEAFVASQYAEQGYEVEALLERPKEFKKTPDLAIKSCQKSFFVECKSLKKIQKKEEYIWNLLFIKINEIMKRCDWCYQLSFICSKPTNPQILETLPHQVYLLCKRNRSFYNVPISDGVIINGKKITRRNASYITPFEFKSSLIDPKVEISIEVMRNEDPFLTEQSNPPCIEIQKYVNTDIRKRIEDNLNTANKQLKNFKPGVVHIEIPFEDHCNFHKSISEIYNRIFYKGLSQMSETSRMVGCG